jgi:hypothetical protein
MGIVVVVVDAAVAVEGHVYGVDGSVGVGGEARGGAGDSDGPGDAITAFDD